MLNPAHSPITSHRLDPLLRPQAIAVLGASRRPGSVGNAVVRNLLAGGFRGPLFAVNPNYTDVEGVPCFATLSELPRGVDQVIFAMGDRHIEAALEQAIRHGAHTGVIYSSLVLDGDREPVLKERVSRMLAQARFLVCGANSMGYYNFRDGIRACGFETREHGPVGGITLISQSGSGMSGILDVDDRMDFNLAISTGQELCVGVEDYLDYALEQPETRVVGVFLETSRRPDRLVMAFQKARERKIPVVAVKVGRTALSAQLTRSHSGAMAGTDAVFDAIFDKYGVQRVDDMDELATSLVMFAQPHPVGPGSLVSIHDSGGERQLLIDVADQTGTPLAHLSPETVRKLESLLDPGLPAVNPLDAWSAGGPEYHLTMAECFATLLRDPDAAFGAVVHDRAARGTVYPAYVDYMRHAHAATGKPVFLVANRQGTGADPLAASVTREGYPVLDGIRPFLAGARALLGFRDAVRRDLQTAGSPETALSKAWRERLETSEYLHEAEAMHLLSDAGIPAPDSGLATSREELQVLASGRSFPLVLKTANPEIAHKSDAGGVVLCIPGLTELLEAYDAMSRRLGSRVTLASMVEAEGVEMILGMHRDAQFGPVVTLGFGGVLAEVARDVRHLIPPFSAQDARRSVDSLRMRALLDGVRGGPPLDVEAFCRTASCFSNLAAVLPERIAELEINPVKVMAKGCIALDALVIASAGGGAGTEEPE